MLIALIFISAGIISIVVARRLQLRSGVLPRRSRDAIDEGVKRKR